MEQEPTTAVPTSEVDNVVHYLMYLFIDGKFYTVFSLLFGENGAYRHTCFISK